MSRLGTLRALLCLGFFLLSHYPSARAQAPTNAITFGSYYAFRSSGPVHVLDLNSDGRLDIFSAALPEFRINVGTLQFNNVLSFTNRDIGYGSPGALADFDNDNDVDVLCINDYRFAPPSIRKSLGIFWNTSRSNSFQPYFVGTPMVSFPFVFRGAAAAADFDNDGDQDILITGNTNSSPYIQGGSITKLYENKGDGTFNLHPANFPAMEESAVSWADYDSDGDFDLLLCGVTNSNNGSASILYRNDNGSLIDSGVALPGLIDASIAWGDYDNDGDLDLLLAGNSNLNNTPLMRLYRNDNGVLSEIPFPAALPVHRLAAWINCDNDGDLDLVVEGRISLNNGDATFQPPISIPASDGRMLSVDFSNDAKPDLLAHDLDGFSAVHYSTTPGANTPPSIPTNLVAVANGSSITFSWSPSLDAQQTGGLSYNLRVGTSPGKSDVLSALANRTNGVRFVAGLGNSGLRTSWTIRNLGAGTFYWTVQAIDHSLAASPFAPEQSIIVSNAPPVAIAHLPRNVTANSAVASASVRFGAERVTYFWEFGATNLAESTASGTLTNQSSPAELLHFLPNLAPGGTYQYRLIASNSLGASISATRIFSTLVTTSLVTELPLAIEPLRFSPSAVPADFENDGDLDLIVCGVPSPRPAGERSTTLYLNDGGAFTKSVFQFPALAAGSSIPVLTAATDLNNDSRVDLVYLVYSLPSKVILLLANPNGTFREESYNFATSPLTLPADPDSDGDIDIFGVRNISQLPGALLNDGISPVRFRPLAALPHEFCILGDYDNDGDPDMLAWGRTNTTLTAPVSHTRILRNDGTGAFNDLAATLPPAWMHTHWADYDNDGDLDVVFAGPESSGLISETNSARLFRNDGPTQFTEVQTGITAGYMTSAQPIDFNGDGLLDLLTSHEQASQFRSRIFLNDGGMHFTEGNLGITNLFLRGSVATAADFDGDKLPDLLLNVATTNINDFELRLFHNNTARILSSPPVPTNLTAEAAATSVKLFWETPATSNEVAGLYFNLRVGTTPGGAEIASPMSHPITGFHRIVQKGNAGQGLNWTIRDLPPGTYYWAVQFVNHALVASPFAPEATFVIPTSERPLRFVNATRNPRHLLTVEGPVRRQALLHSSSNLLDWTELPNYIYLTGTPTPIQTDNRGQIFYRLQLLDAADPASNPTP